MHIHTGIYCADYDNNCIQTLTTQVKFLGKFGKKGSGQGLFDGPWNGVDSIGRLIVSDSDSNRLQVLKQKSFFLQMPVKCLHCLHHKELTE